MNFRKVNNITGWVVCAIASLVYILTAEKAGSFWDCGEFVSAAYKVQMPHPPGAPLFVLLGRFFIVLFGDNAATAAKAVNIMNALASGFTILFLFWTITHFARKLTVGFREEPAGGQLLTIMGAGIVGSLAYTFSDSFWFSAVEGEVYAFSSLFTALAFWLILKWERADIEAGTNAAARARADRWIVLLFFTLGLSIGIHLLGLLTIPAVVMVYYFRRYTYSRWGAIWAFIIGCIITGLVQVVVIQYSVKIAGSFDIFFVDSMHLPFFSGFIFFFVLLGFLLWIGLRYANRKHLPLMRLGIWSFIFIMLGYSSYITPLERSNANPAIDMNNVDNPMNLVYYLGREQYGSQPILLGPHFLAQGTPGERKTLYSKGKNPETGKNEYISYPAPSPEVEYDSKDIQLFPRVWDGNDPRHADFYIQWLNLPVVTARANSYVQAVTDESVQVVEIGNNGQQSQYSYNLPDGYAARVQRGQGVQAGQPIAVQIPTFANNLEWFFTYQMGFMYWRYFMWNFSGRQNDLQGLGNARDGNWITGISFIDNLRLGNQANIPESIRTNKAHNSLLLLPFLLGIFGCIYHFFRDRKDWIVTFLLFFFTGVAIVLYLNQAGAQPRERDYAFAGSYYVFAIWIGLAVIGFARLAREVADRVTLVNTLIYGSLTTFLIMVLGDAANFNTGKLTAALLGAILFAAVSLAITMIVRTAGKTSFRNAGIAATVLCLLVPVLMGAQEWDDHDRSQKLLAPDLAKDYLNSCPKNAILFTYGDNDTYPLWYAQEVEGVRPDIRIINTSLLGIDWYVNQLRYKVNQSAPIDVIWSADQVRGLAYIVTEDRNPREGVFDLLDVMKTIGQQKPRITSFPAVHTVSIPVDAATVKANGVVTAKDSLPTQMVFNLPQGKNFYTLDQLAMLNVIAANAWKRPICFTSPDNSLGFGSYLRQQGMVFQLVPVLSDKPGRSMEVDTTKKLLTEVFRAGNASNGNVYFDEENRRHLLSIRSTYAQGASALSDEGRKPEAVTVLAKAESLMNTKAFPYAMTASTQNQNNHNRTGLLYLEAAYKAGYTDLAAKVKTALVKDLNDQLKYYKYLREFREDYYYQLASDERDAEDFLQIIKQFEQAYEGKKPPVQELPQGAKAADSTKK
ncbi:glycosyltransferase family 117 protein [Flavisolibacter nicotianae]|uniref:glycosyltransferase family 117 protein n=1 Tax=Flavisolibacter nicotianae TaxID=2364882 RepID=UPI001F08D437|nr:DUF2723 domain-containing protein [Flavisolibacter nicotianae]